MSSLNTIEKTVFSNFHRSFNRLLVNLDTRLESISQDTLIDILELNQNINKIIQKIDTINYKLLKKNSNSNSNSNSKKKLSKKQKEYLEDYEKDETIIKAFQPYMLYMYMNL